MYVYEDVDINMELKPVSRWSTQQYYYLLRCRYQHGTETDTDTKNGQHDIYVHEDDEIKTVLKQKPISRWSHSLCSWKCRFQHGTEANIDINMLNTVNYS